MSPHIAAIYVSNSPCTRIGNNTKIQCTNLTGYSASDAQYIAGVYMATSPSSTVNCNTVNFVGEGFVWEGLSPTSQWYKNNVQHSRYGLVLRSSASMGDQGSLLHPAGNIWGQYISSNLTNAQTLADGTNPITTPSSKLYGTVYNM